MFFSPSIKEPTMKRLVAIAAAVVTSLVLTASALAVPPGPCKQAASKAAAKPAKAAQKAPALHRHRAAF
jgi:hypothetical protein